MTLIIKIAWRNIQRHRGKSLVIGMILFVGAFLMTLGNGVISGMNKGLEENIIGSFTGDIVLVSQKQDFDEVFIDMMGKTVEPINNFKAIDSMLKTIDGLAAWVPIGKNAVLVLNEESGSPGMAYLLGVDFERYAKVFPNSLTALEGDLLKPGEQGILVPAYSRKQMFDVSNIWFVPQGCEVDTANMFPEAKAVRSILVTKRDVVLMGMGAENTSTDVRLPIMGIVKYRALNSVFGNFSIADIESYRNCQGYIAAADKATMTLSEDDETLLSGEETDLDNLFTGERMINDDALLGKKKEKLAGETGNAQPADDSQPAAALTDLDEGAYNLVLVLLKDHSKIEESIKVLNEKLSAAGIGVRAVHWKKAVGSIGSMASLIKAVLFMFVMFLFFVAVIVIVNTLSMAALERTPEIGMMRAVGARRGFISKMFVGETAMLSFFFGDLGIIAGWITVRILALCNIKSDNDMVQMIFGGDVFQPFLSGGDMLLAVVQLVIVTVVAVIYPMRIAQSITPLDAVSRE